jgi:cytochrome c oxidase cbb3-type subunit 2
MNDATEFEREKGVPPVAVFIVASVYAYYLIFAEIAFLRLAEPFVEGSRQLSFLRSVLGAGGLVGGLVGGWRFRLLRYPRTLSHALRACAIAAILALMVQSWELLLMVAALVGFALGWLLVVMVAGLRACVGTPRLGLCVGLGTGLAHALFTLPWFVAANPTMQTVVATVLIGMAAVFTPWLLPQEPSLAWSNDYRTDGMAAWMAIFLALMWIDASAFVVIPRPEAGLAWLTAAAALAASVLGGLWLDRGARASVALASFSLLALAGAAIASGRGLPGATTLLAGGGGALAATALFHLAALGGRAWQIGVLFAVSLWIGSALGVGMGRELGTVPWSFLIGAGVVVGGALAWRETQRRSDSRRG